MQEIKLKKDWSLTPTALHRLLNWLDEGADSEGRQYLEMRRRLTAYFDRKDCPTPDDLADETLNRVARRLEEECAIETEVPAKYCYIVARYVFLEYLRARTKDQALHSEIRRESRGDTAEDEANRQNKERMLQCLEECAEKMDGANRELIFGYYFGTERVKIQNRRAQAKALGITINALSIRACRIREKLEVCVRQCLGSP